MRIQFTDSVAGARFAYRIGEKVTLDDDVARDFIKSRQAIELKDEVPVREALVEAAVAAAPEQAVTRGARRRKSIRNLGGLLPG